MKKTNNIFILFLALSTCAFSQTTNEVATLSNGRYIEVFENDTIQRIGSVMFNTVSNKIEYFIEEGNSAVNQIAESSRWMSMDPLANKYPSMSPYNFVGNSPIAFIDPNGKEICIFYDSGKKDDEGYPILEFYNYGSGIGVPDNEFVRQTIAALEMMGKVNEVAGQPGAENLTPSEVLSKLTTDPTIIVSIYESVDGNHHTQIGRKSSIVFFDVTEGKFFIELLADGKQKIVGSAPPAAGISHELKHAYNALITPVEFKCNRNDKEIANTPDINMATFPNREEYNTSMYDNSFLKYYGYGERKSYMYMEYRVSSSTSNVPLVTPELELGPEIEILK